MLGTIIRNQILENIYGIKFIVIFCVCLVLMVGTTITGLGRYATHQEDENHIVSTNRKSLADAGDWRDVGREGIKVVKPANRLGILSAGLEDSVGRTATIKVDDFPYLEDSIYSTAPIFAIFGELDLTFIMRTVISLFVILFTFDLISGEKERGTLKQCLANPVPRNTFMLGKSIGSLISLLIPIVIPLLISLLIVLLGGVSYGSVEWAAIGIIFLGYVFYVLAFFSIGVFVSTLVRSSSVSFLILLFFWIVAVLVIPKGSMMVASQINPIPSINDVRANQFTLRENFNQQVWRRIAEEHSARGIDAIQDMRQRFMAMRGLRSEIWDELEPGYEEQKKKINDDFKRDQAYLTELAVNMSRVSPASAVTYISMNMAGTGYQEQENFLRQLTLFRGQFADHIELMIEQEGENRGPGRFMMTAEEEQGQLDINSIPDFSYQQYSVGERLAMVLPDFAALALISIIFYLLAFINFIRYDVR